MVHGDALLHSFVGLRIHGQHLPFPAHSPLAFAAGGRGQPARQRLRLAQARQVLDEPQPDGLADVPGILGGELVAAGHGQHERRVTAHQLMSTPPRSHRSRSPVLADRHPMRPPWARSSYLTADRADGDSGSTVCLCGDWLSGGDTSPGIPARSDAREYLQRLAILRHRQARGQERLQRLAKRVPVLVQPGQGAPRSAAPRTTCHSTTPTHQDRKPSPPDPARVTPCRSRTLNRSPGRPWNT